MEILSFILIGLILYILNLPFKLFIGEYYLSNIRFKDKISGKYSDLINENATQNHNEIPEINQITGYFIRKVKIYQYVYIGAMLLIIIPLYSAFLLENYSVFESIFGCIVIVIFIIAGVELFYLPILSEKIREKIEWKNVYLKNKYNDFFESNYFNRYRYWYLYYFNGNNEVCDMDDFLLYTFRESYLPITKKYLISKFEVTFQNTPIIRINDSDLLFLKENKKCILKFKDLKFSDATDTIVIDGRWCLKYDNLGFKIKECFKKVNFYIWIEGNSKIKTNCITVTFIFNYDDSFERYLITLIKINNSSKANDNMRYISILSIVNEKIFKRKLKEHFELLSEYICKADI